jgi:hypothetical protein
MGISLEVDLSKELTAPSKPRLEEQLEATAQVCSVKGGAVV